jgi:sucrose 6(F)-phosphate phosphorylase
MVRLDAVGYVIKRPGTSCFMVEPEIYHFLAWIAGVAQSMGLEVLPEVHDHYSVQKELAEHGYWVYDFVLPGLILHTLFTRSSAKLRQYLEICPRKQFTMLDCHDGIPVQPDLDGILAPEEAIRIVDLCLRRGANVNPILSNNHGQQPHFDAHQINCTYYSALGNDDDAYLAARAIQFFAPGVPQVYYVGLLAGKNDLAAVQATGEGRAINRHDYRVDEVEGAVGAPVVQRLLQLIRFRNEYTAFQGDFSVADSPDKALSLAWKNGADWCQLDIDLDTSRAVISYVDLEGKVAKYPV